MIRVQAIVFFSVIFSFSSFAECTFRSVWDRETSRFRTVRVCGSNSASDCTLTHAWDNELRRNRVFEVCGQASQGGSSTSGETTPVPSSLSFSGLELSLWWNTDSVIELSDFPMSTVSPLNPEQIKKVKHSSAIYTFEGRNLGGYSFVKDLKSERPEDWKTVNKFKNLSELISELLRIDDFQITSIFLEIMLQDILGEDLGGKIKKFIFSGVPNREGFPKFSLSPRDSFAPFCSWPGYYECPLGVYASYATGIVVELENGQKWRVLDSNNQGQINILNRIGLQVDHPWHHSYSPLSFENYQKASKGKFSINFSLYSGLGYTKNDQPASIYLVKLNQLGDEAIPRQVKTFNNNSVWETSFEYDNATGGFKILDFKNRSSEPTEVTTGPVIDFFRDLFN